VIPLAACEGTAAPPTAQKSEKIAAVEAKAAEAIEFVVEDPNAQVEFEMEAPFERITGVVPSSAIGGEISLDPKDIGRTTGLLEVDISELEIFQETAETEGEYGERQKSDLQNEHMREWLEIGPTAPDDERAKNSVVQFALRAVESPSVADLSALSGTERKVTFTGVGEFRLHQRSSEKRIALEAVFGFAGDTPTSFSARTTEPFAVDLAEHDVRPRTAFGKLAQKSLDAMAPKVAKQAEVSVSFAARAKK
jgi:hypothetical protein